MIEDSSNRARLVDKWILNQLVETVEAIEVNFQNEYQFHLIVKRLREFFYGAYCDFYLESTKPLLKKTTTNITKMEEKQQEYVWNILRACSRMTLLMYHPFVPSLTEELWQKYRMGGEGSGKSILDAKYPKYAELSKLKV